MAKKKEGLQLGNFIVTRETGVLDRIKITDVNGVWSVKFQSNNEFYQMIDHLIKTVETHEYFKSLIVLMYTACNGYKDENFMVDYFKFYNEQMQRLDVLYDRKNTVEPLTVEEVLE